MEISFSAAVAFGICLIIAAALLGGRYQAVSGTTATIANGGVYVVDRFTGQTSFCLVKDCRPLGPPLPAPFAALPPASQ